MKNKFIFFIAPAVICWCLFSLQACKSPGIENSSLLTKSDNLSLLKDTLSISVTTQNEIPQASNLVSQGVLGNIWDKNFGTEYGSFAAQCDLTTSGVFFGYGATLDSAVLTLAYNGSYGPCTQPINIAVYQLNQPLFDSLTYYTNNNFHVYNPPIGQLNHFVPNFYDSIYLQTCACNVAPQIRIPLSYAFGSKLLNTQFNADSVFLQSDSAWLSFFNGIYVTTTSTATGNGMIYVNLPSALTGITLYYHYASLGFGYPDTSATSFVFPFAGVTINHFDNVYQNTPANSAVHTPVSSTAQKVFIEGGCGLRGLIKINLDTLAKLVGVRNLDSIPKKIGINLAELVLTQSKPDSQYTAPAILNLGRLDDAGQNIALDDASLTGYGGIIENDLVNNVSLVRYRFDISVYLEKLIQGIYNNNGIVITVNNENSAVDRLVLTNSSTNKYYKVSLAITYTKF